MLSSWHSFLMLFVSSISPLACPFFSLLRIRCFPLPVPGILQGEYFISFLIGSKDNKPNSNQMVVPLPFYIWFRLFCCCCPKVVQGLCTIKRHKSPFPAVWSLPQQQLCSRAELGMLHNRLHTGPPLWNALTHHLGGITLSLGPCFSKLSSAGNRNSDGWGL